MTRFDNHTHSEYSNSSLSFPDSTNKLKSLIQRAYDIGLAGINISDHECLSGAVEAINYYNSMPKNRDFKISIGNEIYLLTKEEYEANKEQATYPYYHFVLTALDTEGYKQLCQLSNRAWQRAWKSFIWRRPTLYEDLYEIVKPNQGHIIASSACLGSRIDRCLLENNIGQAIREVEKFQDIFGLEYFYLEVQPSVKIGNDQSVSNERMKQLIKETGCKCVVTTDAHYLCKEDRVVHKAYLNSGEGDRETDEFYATAYLMDNNDLREHLHHEFNDKQIDWFFKNSLEIYDRIKEYDIFHAPIIPLIPEDKIPDFTIQHCFEKYYKGRPNFEYYAYRDNIHEQFFFYQLEQGLIKHIVNTNKKDNLIQYLDRIELELKELKEIGEILDTKMACYYSTMSQIIKLCWEVGSYVGPSRGSALGYVTNYLLEITQIDPVPFGEYTPYWRHLSKERGAEIGDVDSDSEPSAKYKIIEAMKEYFGYDKTLQVATFSKISSKTAIEKACRGLNVTLEEANFMKSLIPVNRGKVAKLKDCLYGENKITELHNTMLKYDNLIETALALEGLITNRGVHAAGITVCNEPYTAYLSSMRSADGAMTTNMNLIDSEAVSLVKFDMLTVSAIQKIHRCVDFCIQNGLMEWQGSHKATYDKYLHPDVINYDNQEMWAMIPKIFSVFQFDTPISQKVLARIKPNNLYDLSESNNIMRLAPEDLDETPLDMYCRYKNDIQEFFNDCKQYGLIQDETNVVYDILKESYGVCGSQENLMRLSMNDKVSGFGLKEANKLRKSIAKKDENLQAQVKELFYEKGLELGTREVFLNYIWNKQFMIQKSYAFSSLHSLAYSVIALQEANLNYFYSPACWIAACLSVESLPDEGSGNGVDYGKIAKAIYNAKNSNIEVAPPSINNADVDFSPDIKTDTIYYSLSCVSGINQDIVQEIIDNRPYNSFDDFYNKFSNKQGTKITHSKFITLIKAGCFAEFENDSIALMKHYFELKFEPKQSLTIANLPTLLDYYSEQEIKDSGLDEAIQMYWFKKNVVTKENYYKNDEHFKTKKHYVIPNDLQWYFFENISSLLKENTDYYFDGDDVIVIDKSLDKALKPQIKLLQDWLAKEETIQRYNQQTVKKNYEQNIPVEDSNKWNFETLSYYSNQHELANVNYEEYNLSDFTTLSMEPNFIERKWGKRTWKEFELSRIAGTIVNKNDIKHTVTILTRENQVVNVKFYDGEFANYKKVEKDEEGNVLQENWFKRGQLIMVAGYRNGENDFKAKKYSKSIFMHTVTLIKKVYEDGSLNIQIEKNVMGD